MRKLLYLFILPVIFSLLCTSAQAATTPTAPVSDPAPTIINKLSSLTLKEAQQLAGRKFTLKEKIGFWLFKKQVRKGQEKGFSKTAFYKAFSKKARRADEPGSKGMAALSFGIASVIFLILGFFIPYIIIVSPIAAILAIVLGTIAKKKDPDDTKGQIGKLLGWISLGVFVALIIAVAIAFSDGFGWG